MVSATECAPSASIAAEWPISPAPSFATAMAKFAAMAAYTVFLLSLATGRSQPEVGPDPDEGPGSAGPGPASGPCHSTRPASAPPVSRTPTAARRSAPPSAPTTRAVRSCELAAISPPAPETGGPPQFRVRPPAGEGSLLTRAVL